MTIKFALIRSSNSSVIVDFEVQALDLYSAIKEADKYARKEFGNKWSETYDLMMRVTG